MTATIGEFIAKVIKTLHDNGYPDKRVSLPLDKMYELAAQKGYSFNKVLEFLKEKEGIGHEKTTEKLIFFPLKNDTELNEAFRSFDPSHLGELDFASLMGQAAELVKNMKPEQLSQIQDLIQNLSDEEKEDLLRKAKDLGFPD